MVDNKKLRKEKARSNLDCEEELSLEVLNAIEKVKLNVPLDSSLMNKISVHAIGRVLISQLESRGACGEMGNIQQDPEVAFLMNQAKKALEESRGSDALRHLILAKQRIRTAPGLDVMRGKAFILMNKLGDAREAFLEELRHYPENKEAADLLDSLRKSGAAEYGTSDLVDRDDVFFQEILEKIRPFSMLEEHRLYYLSLLSREICKSKLPGNFVECGVAGGGSSAMLAYIIKSFSEDNRKIFACDSFEGMPKPGENDFWLGTAAEETGWGTGTCAAPEESVVAACTKLGVEDKLVTVKGYFEDTLPAVKSDIGAIAFLHIDCDWYESTLTILHNLYDQIVPGGLVQVDDFGTWEGVEKGLCEFFEERNLRIDLTDIRGAAWFQKPLNSTFDNGLLDK